MTVVTLHGLEVRSHGVVESPPGREGVHAACRHLDGPTPAVNAPAGPGVANVATSARLTENSSDGMESWWTLACWLSPRSWHGRFCCRPTRGIEI